MRESHVEGVATHDDPEPCTGACEGVGEAWDRGTCGPGIEPRNFYSRVPTVLSEPEGNTHRTENARRGVTLRGRRPRARTNLSAREPGDLRNARRHGSGGTHREGHEPQADDERSGEVRLNLPRFGGQPMTR
jgi:hypothetical protein